MEESYFLRILTRTVTLTLKIGIQPLRMALRVMLMHHHTKFGSIGFSGSEDIFWTKVLQSDRQTDRQHDSNTPPPPARVTTLREMGVGV